MTKPLSKAVEKENMPKIQKSNVDEIFTLVENKDGVKIAIGNYQISKKTFKDFKHADSYLEKKPYEILINVASLIAAQSIESYENIKKTKAEN